MTPHKAKKLLPIIKAYSEGKTVQYKPFVTGAGWMDFPTGDLPTDPTFDSYADFRIKPEPKWRMWNPEEVPYGARLVEDHNPSGKTMDPIIIGLNCTQEPSTELNVASPDGYGTWNVLVKPGISRWYWGNLGPFTAQPIGVLEETES